MQPVKKVLMDATGKRFFIRDTSNDYHCQHGLVKAADLRKKAGSKVKTNTGKEMTLFGPSFVDSYAKIRRGAQIIPLKDVAYIIAETGVNKKSVCLDAGSGSGALTLALANVAKKVYSYEIREDFHKLVKENIEAMGMKNIVLKHKDIYEGISEKNLDIITLDLPEPWKAIGHAEESLKPGGFLVSYSPTIPQVSDFVEAVRKAGFTYLKTVEIILREWEVDARKIRPRSQPIGHSGFITFCRKC